MEQLQHLRGGLAIAHQAKAGHGDHEDWQFAGDAAAEWFYQLRSEHSRVGFGDLGPVADAVELGN